MPVYVTGGATLFTRRTIKDLFYASLFTVPFAVDDIYIGRLAKKLDLEPIDASKSFSTYRCDIPPPSDISKMVAVHQFHNPIDMYRTWLRERKSNNT